MKRGVGLSLIRNIDNLALATARNIRSLTDRRFPYIRGNEARRDSTTRPTQR